ncbi:hypothetical protein GCM10010392_07470 [Streptomyces clavifer]|nr:hypothetical protein GCM10010392_07470 [Streptomyces clavifer]
MYALSVTLDGSGVHPYATTAHDRLSGPGRPRPARPRPGRRTGRARLRITSRTPCRPGTPHPSGPNDRMGQMRTHPSRAIWLISPLTRPCGTSHHRQGCVVRPYDGRGTGARRAQRVHGSAPRS